MQPQQFNNIPNSGKPMDLHESKSRLKQLMNNEQAGEQQGEVKIRSRIMDRHKSVEQPQVAPDPQEGAWQENERLVQARSSMVQGEQASEQLQPEVGTEMHQAQQVEQQSQTMPPVPPAPIQEDPAVQDAKQQKVEELVEELEDVEASADVEAEEEVFTPAGDPISGEYWSQVWNHYHVDAGHLNTHEDEKIVLEVSLPQDNEIEINAAEQMFAGLIGVGEKAGGGLFETVVSMVPQMESFFKNPTHALSFEITATSHGIQFWVVIPKKFQDLVEGQIHGSYQVAQIDAAKTEEFLHSEGSVSMVTIRPQGKIFYPIRSAEELGTDPINAITSSVSKLNDRQRVVIQYLIQPSDEIWRKKGESFVNTARNPSDEKKSKNIDPKIIDAVSSKISKPGFRTVIRILAQGQDKFESNTLATNVARAYDQLSVPGLAVLKDSSVGIKKEVVDDFIMRSFPVKGNYPIFNTAELATMYHFPNTQVTTPGIKWLRSRIHPPPDNVPSDGLYLGYSEFRGKRVDIHLGQEDRRRHMYIIGQTGTGKSEFLKSLAQQDIVNGDGLAFIDPHGDAVLDLLEMIPKERAEDVIYFDPADIERPPGLNILEAKTEEAKHMVVNSFIGLLYKLYDPGHTGIIGPQLERTVRNVMLTAMAEDGNSMIEVLKLIIDPKFIETKIHLVDDPLVKSFWVDQMAATSEQTRSEQLGYFVSKFDRFVTEKLMRNIIGQSTSAFNFRDVMDQQKILLVNLSKGQLGEENSTFLGLLLVPRLLSAAMSRVDIPQEERKDFYLYVDEFQNFATSDFVQILSEARKYRLCLTVANQFISQMQDDIRDAVFGNVGTTISFRVGQDDSEYLEKQLEPNFTSNDLVNLTIGKAVNRLLIGGHPSEPFSLTSDWPRISSLPRNEKIAEIVKEISRLKYGKDRRIVESEINARAGF